MLIDFFALIEGEGYRLWLFGKGELEELISMHLKKIIGLNIRVLYLAHKKSFGEIT